MRFLLDENQSPLLVGLLAAEGHDVAHVRDLGQAGSSDESLFALAAAQGWVIVSGDTDFGELLARTPPTCSPPKPNASASSSRTVSTYT